MCGLKSILRLILRPKAGLAVFLILFICSALNLKASFADEISARSALVIDGGSERILFAKNPNMKLPPASTTKLMTAMVVLDRLQPDSIVTVSKIAANTPSVTPHLKAGERYTVRDLLHIALMRSVNSAAVALAEAVGGSEDAFAEMMNSKALSIGADDTKFINASGLPGAGQYVTAYDLAKIMKESLKYSMIREIINTRTKQIYTAEGRKLFIKNTDQLLWNDDDVVGGKTGYTRAARHCFVGAVKKGQHTLITVVLGEPVRDNLWEITNILTAKGDDVLNNRTDSTISISDSYKASVVKASYRKGSRTQKEEITPASYNKSKSAKNKARSKSTLKVKSQKRLKHKNSAVKTNNKKTGKNKYARSFSAEYSGKKL
jgi:D-alanyl-D-alanine carboxypeptidase (penicillin-binding protein 5/6)